MVNWNDPAILARTYLDFIKLEHALAGVYIWEYVTNLYYEWEFVSGKRKWLWTLSIYSSCRFCCLMFTILNLVGMDVTREINCQAFTALSMALAALLIVLRIAAIWDRNRIVTVLASIIWIGSGAFWIREVIRSRGMWNPAGGGCLDLLTVRGRPMGVISFASDASLLLIMLVGLLLKGESSRFGIWRMLYHQGLIWLGMATIAELPVVILLYKNINDVWNLMFQTPALLIMVIGATRMYRSLTNYANKHEISSGLPVAASGPQPSSIQFGTFRTTANANAVSAVRPIDIAVDRQRSETDTLDDHAQDADKVRALNFDIEVGAAAADRALYGGTKEAASSRHSSDGF
ncbi:hypothetical protein FA95DRAFT_1605852 [Auriscalpium vulgare]|uniref:Uncharacterized protein n=1 Tax=Auriscalpium vulgare TaxID=40419 RepID=A0ACB8RVA4_9AGAM|nr:hypothetical protein FA95DRAFT_1605852 [Auriscalpium vulgare]